MYELSWTPCPQRTHARMYVSLQGDARFLFPKKAYVMVADNTPHLHLRGKGED